MVATKWLEDYIKNPLKRQVYVTFRTENRPNKFGRSLVGEQIEGLLVME